MKKPLASCAEKRREAKHQFLLFINEAVKRSLAEYAEEIEEIEKELGIPFEDVVRRLKKRGKI